MGVIVVLLETRVGRRSKKPSAFHRATLRYLEKEYRERMARGEEPPFDLENLLRLYGSSPPNSEVSAPPSSSAPARNPLEHSAFQPVKDLGVIFRKGSGSQPVPNEN